MSHRRLAVWCLAVCIAGAAHAESVPGLVEEGNRHYKEGRLAEALEKYRRAATLDPASPALHYNIGNVLYRQGEFEKAYEQYRQAFSAREKELAQGARFNAGNTHFARKNWQEAIRSYQEALRLSSDDLDSKKNLELALLNMREEQEKRQNQPDEQQDKPEQNESDPPQRQDQKDDSKQPSPESAQPRPMDQKQGQAKDQLSREEAMRLLDAMKDQDKPPRDRLKVPPPDRKPEKDW